MHHLLAMLLVLLIGIPVAYAQPANDDCSNAQVLCSNVLFSGTTISATPQCGGPDGDCLAAGSWAQCYDVNNSVWFTFRSNSAGGAATVTLSNSSCGAGFRLQGVLLAASTPCDPASYVSLSCDTGLAGGFVLNSTLLAANTQYWVQIDGATSAPNLSECTFDIEITGPAVAWIVQPTVTAESCDPGNDGAISLNVSGNFPAYTYVWSNGQTGSSLNNLSAGTYSVTITGAQGCDTLVEVLVPLAPGITAVALSSTPIACSASTGTITVDSVTGGSPAYNYSIDGGANFQSSTTFNGLAAGSYQVITVDQNNCQDTSVIIVEEPDPPVGTAVVTPADCGQQNGSIVVSVQGGTSPYTFTPAGSGGATSGTYDNLAAGTYTIVVEDANGCSDTLVEIVPQNELLEAVPVATPIECQSTSGAITVTQVSGGTAPYTYTLDQGASQVFSTFSGLNAGTYQVTIAGSGGCSADYTVSIENVCPPVSISNAFSPNGDGLNETWYLQNLAAYDRSRVLVFNRWGQRVFRSTGYKIPWDGTLAGRTLPAGTYFYQITLDFEDPDAQSFNGYITLMR